MGRKKARKSDRRKRTTADDNEMLGLFYRRQGPILYGFIAFVRHRPNSATASKAHKTSSPFIISETIGDEEVICGSVVNLIQEVRRLVADSWTQVDKLASEFRHIQPSGVEQGSRVQMLVMLPEELSADDARRYAEFKRGLIGTLILLSTQARNLFEIFPQVVRNRDISLVDYEGNPSGTVALRDLLIAFIHHRYLFLDGEYVSDLFPSNPKKSPIKRTFMGFKFSWVEYIQAIERVALEIKMKHLTGLLRGRLKRLTLKSPYDEIIFLVQNLESFSRLLGKKVPDDRYRRILQLMFDAKTQELLKSIEPRLGDDSRVINHILFAAPTFKIHEKLSERMFKVSVNRRWEARAASDGRLLHMDEEFKTVTIEVKYARAFDLVNQAFGEDSLVS